MVCQPEASACMLWGSHMNNNNGYVLFVSQSINIYNVLGGNWDPTDKKFSSVNSYRQDLLPTCKAFPKVATDSICLMSWGATQTQQTNSSVQ